MQQSAKDPNTFRMVFAKPHIAHVAALTLPFGSAPSLRLLVLAPSVSHLGVLPCCGFGWLALLRVVLWLVVRFWLWFSLLAFGFVPCFGFGWLALLGVVLWFVVRLWFWSLLLAFGKLLHVLVLCVLLWPLPLAFCSF